MKSLLKPLFAFVAFAFCTTSCGLFKRIPVETHVRDSVSITYKDSTIIKDSVVYVTVPVEQYVNVALPGQSSYLQSSLAETTAFTDSLGFLHHTLRNKSDQRIPVIVQNIEKHTVAQAYTDKSKEIIRTVQVEKKLNWWQKFRMRGFWWLLIFLVIENAIIIFVVYRKFISHG